MQAGLGKGHPAGTPPHTHLFVNVGVDPLLALEPLGGHPAQLLLGALVALQQGAVRVLAAGVVRRGPQPVERRLSTKKRVRRSGPAPEAAPGCHLPQPDQWDPTRRHTGCWEGSPRTQNRARQRRSSEEQQLPRKRSVVSVTS